MSNTLDFTIYLSYFFYYIIMYYFFNFRNNDLNGAEGFVCFAESLPFLKKVEKLVLDVA
jgi:hypothetical protein